MTDEHHDEYREWWIDDGIVNTVPLRRGGARGCVVKN
jgi:hypothetical protein